MAEATTVAELVELAKTQDESSDEYLATLEQLKAIATGSSGQEAVDAQVGLDQVLKGAAGAENAGGGASGGSTQGDQTWVVQRLVRDARDEDPAPLWIDVATVTVPPRTKRKTIVQKALETAPQQVPPKDADVDTPFRVLDADSAEEIPVGWDVPPAPKPQLRIG